jgi:uncharacterized membrane protein (UPF0127 family)
MRSLPLLLLAVLLAGLPACSPDSGEPSSSSTTADTTTIPFDREGRLGFIQQGDTLVVLDIEVADTDSARERGMMQREGFPSETSGMLFPFDEEAEQSFWMANTPLSLDLFFVDADSQVVNIHKYAQPNTAEQIPSEEPAKYVLETPAGFADSYGILEGDRVWWRRTEPPED